MIGDNETNFPHKLLLTNRQVANLSKAFANHLSTDIKLSKNQLSKMIQSGGFLGRLRGPLSKTGLPLTKNVINQLAKSVLIILWFTVTASKNTTTRILSNDMELVTNDMQLLNTLQLVYYFKELLKQFKMK